MEIFNKRSFRIAVFVVLVFVNIILLLAYVAAKNDRPPRTSFQFQNDLEKAILEKRDIEHFKKIVEIEGKKGLRFFYINKDLNKYYINHSGYGFYANYDYTDSRIKNWNEGHVWTFYHD